MQCQQAVIAECADVAGFAANVEPTQNQTRKINNKKRLGPNQPDFAECSSLRSIPRIKSTPQMTVPPTVYLLALVLKVLATDQGSPILYFGAIGWPLPRNWTRH